MSMGAASLGVVVTTSESVPNLAFREAKDAPASAPPVPCQWGDPGRTSIGTAIL